MINLIKDIISNRKMIIELAFSDFKKRFVGSYFGVVWMFVQPLATVLVYTLIFQIGFRATPPIPNIPYVVWLIAGIVPWFYFQETLIQNTNCLYEYNFLVKKVVFNISLLPIIKLVSTTLSHLCFIIILFIALIIAKVDFSFQWFLIFYYSFMLSLLILGLSYITSSINVFFKDMAQIVNILLQFGIWMCPIMYDESLFSNKSELISKLLMLNPMYYIINGYRNALIGQKFNHNFIYLTIYYLVITLIILIFGYKLFNKLKEQFADVL